MEATISALAAGLLVGVNRFVIAELAQKKGVFFSSFINHLGGTIFLLIVFFFLFPANLIEAKTFSSLPLFYFSGGIIGGTYVALSTFLIGKIQLSKSLILLVIGQLFSGLFLDFLAQESINLALNFLGAIFLLLGLFLLRFSPAEKKTLTISK